MVFDCGKLLLICRRFDLCYCHKQKAERLCHNGCDQHRSICPAFRHSDYRILSYGNRDSMAFPLWAADSAVMASCPLAAGACKDIPEMEYMGLPRIAFSAGDDRKLCNQPDYRRSGVGRGASITEILGKCVRGNHRQHPVFKHWEGEKVEEMIISNAFQ